MRSPRLHHPGDALTAAELSALRLDGELYEVGDAFMPADVPESAIARALSIARLLPVGFAASGPSAAWVHGAGDQAPSRHHVRPIGQRRRRAASQLRLVVHEATVSAEDLVRIAGVGVVGVVETIVELARGADASGYSAWLAALATQHPEEAEAARERLRARARLPGKHRALEALDAVRTT